MPLILRPPTVEDLLPALGELCMRSKAIWGYDAKFMAMCRGELSFASDDLQLTRIAVAQEGSDMVGVAQVKVAASEADLLKLFVDPGTLRSGVGKALFTWATEVARELGADRLLIDADPDAAPFYRRMGARNVGVAPSGSVPGRMLPKLVMNLRSANGATMPVLG
jgi:GNAT superfamily N-acetyltransferase